MNTFDLKACPFCNSNATTIYVYLQGYSIHCTGKCHYAFKLKGIGANNTLSVLVDAWNDRPVTNQK